jgi:sec-independent protein translocase protein TatA
MGLDNPIHIAFLLVILLLVFGAKRLPEMGRSLGSGLRGFKESINGEHTEQLPAATTMAVVPAATTMTAVSTDEPERDHAGTASAV